MDESALLRPSTIITIKPLRPEIRPTVEARPERADYCTKRRRPDFAFIRLPALRLLETAQLPERSARVSCNMAGLAARIPYPKAYRPRCSDVRRCACRTRPLPVCQSETANPRRNEAGAGPHAFSAPHPRQGAPFRGNVSNDTYGYENPLRRDGGDSERSTLWPVNGLSVGCAAIWRRRRPAFRGSR